MKARLLAAMLLPACMYMQSCIPSYAKEKALENTSKECLDISFRFQRGGIASSQYAIWIEDETGRLVRTLYVTSFTAKGGYAYRKDAVPAWVRKAKPAEMPADEIDALTGATPRNGTVNYTWDGTDDKGNPVPKGTYTVFVEGTLYWENRIVYSGKVNWGSQTQQSVPITSRRYGTSPTNKDMITDLKFFHARKK